MTIKEWAKEYPKTASSLFECSIDDLDSALEEKPIDDTDNNRYFTKADVDKLMEMLNI